MTEMGAKRLKKCVGQLLDAQVKEPRKSLNLRALGESERILYIDTQISNSAFNLGVTQQNLNGAQVARLLVNDGRFGSAERVGAIVLPEQSNPGYPLINKSCILPGADMLGVIDPARKDKVVKGASATFKPSQDAGAGGLQELELDRPTGLLLDDDCSGTNPTTPDKVADLDFDDVATAQLAVDREIEHRTVA